MAEKKKNDNPFNIFKDAGTRHIEVKALDGAKVEIKNALTVEQTNQVKATCYRNQEIVGTTAVPNQSDFMMSKIQAVSYLLVEPKMSMTELGKLEGADDAIAEIYDAYEEHRKEQHKGN